MTNDQQPRQAIAPPQQVAVHGYFVPVEAPPSQPRITLHDVWKSVVKHRIVFAVAILACITVAIIWAQTATRIYRATALVKVVEEDERLGALSSLTSQFGGLASLAGLRLPGGSSRAEVVAVLQSGSLAEQFINEHQLMPLLFPRAWNEEKAEWKNPDVTARPSMADAVKQFSRQVRSVREDKLTGLVKISVRWRDSRTAAAWANDLVRSANERMRQRAVDEAKRSLEYLKQELQKTTNIELQQAIYRLMQEQLNSATLASVRTEYALQMIDPAPVADADEYVWPRPAVLLLFGIGVGLLIGTAAALVLERGKRTT